MEKCLAFFTRPNDLDCRVLSLVTVLILTLFVTRIMHFHTPPDDFSSWPTEKKEVYLHEHDMPSVHGFELLKLWLNEPNEALGFVVPELELIFPLAWIAAFLGGFWQMRNDRNTPFRLRGSIHAGDTHVEP